MCTILPFIPNKLYNIINCRFYYALLIRRHAVELCPGYLVNVVVSLIFI